jgi:hypothetical protein
MQLRHLRVPFPMPLIATRLVTVDGLKAPVFGIIADMSASALLTIRATQGVASVSDPVGLGGCVAAISISSAVQG